MHGSRTQNYSCGVLFIPIKLSETFFSKSWEICFQTYQVNKIKLHACLIFPPSSSTLLESGFHQIGFIKSLEALSAFIWNSTEDSLTYFICIFCQYVHYWAFVTDFKNLMYVMNYFLHDILCPSTVTTCCHVLHYRYVFESYS